MGGYVCALTSFSLSLPLIMIRYVTSSLRPYPSFRYTLRLVVSDLACLLRSDLSCLVVGGGQQTSPCNATVGDRLITYATVLKASPQKDLDNIASEGKHRTLSTRVLFILSAKPFSCGVFGGVL